ncbi:hypothetical protein FRC06_011722 [Ceratobasidium sp. 370]|nr:hypothetical protein FRC06_011722 [Ceratobasidium sp. 370]
MIPRATVLRPAKRSVDPADVATVQRMRLADPDNTDTEPESDAEPVLASTGPPPTPPAPPAVCAEPPTATITGQSTATTLPETPLEGQSTGSLFLGGSSVPRFTPPPSSCRRL